MGLSDVYDNLRNQILVLDPLPSVHKAYSMALRVEKQREVQVNFAAPTEISAMFAKSNNNFEKQNSSTQYKGKQDYKPKNQSDSYYNHCKIPGHTKESCFKLTGYPDWYKELKEKKRSGGHNSAHMVEGGYSDIQDDPLNQEMNQDVNPSINAMLAQFSQFLKANQQNEVHTANFTHLGDFAGMKLNFSFLNSLKSDLLAKDVWILDTGATAHMCNNIAVLNTSK